MLGLLLLVPPGSVPTARVATPAVDELSGIALSRRFPGTYWVQNDSGDSPRLFAVRADGSLVVPPKYDRKSDTGKPGKKPKEYEGLEITGAANDDWEDLCADHENLYIADLGNNGNARRDLTIYAVREPNPAETERARPWARWTVAYPDQKAFPPQGDRRFDCEAIFSLRGSLYALTKWRNVIGFPDDGTALYRLDKPREGMVNVLRKVEEKRGLGGWVTAADATPSGDRLAVLCHLPRPCVWIFDARGSRPLSKPIKRIDLDPAVGQCEALTWVSANEVLVTNEPGAMFRVRV